MLTQVIFAFTRTWDVRYELVIKRAIFFEDHSASNIIFAATQVRRKQSNYYFLALFYSILYLLVRGHSNSNLSQLNFFVLHPLVRFLSRKNSSFKWIGHSCLGSPYFRLPTCVSHARLNMYDIMHNQSTFRWYHNMLSKKNPKNKKKHRTRASLFEKIRTRNY